MLFRSRLSNVVPALVVHVLAPVVFEGVESLAGFVQGLAKVYLVVVLLFTLQALLNGLQTIYQRYDISKHIPIKGLLQALMLVAFFVGGVFIISIVMGREIGTLMAGLGAMVMGFLFVFKARSWAWWRGFRSPPTTLCARATGSR